jgi:hypothetical protein
VVGAGDHAQAVVEPVSVDRVRGDWHAPHGSVEIIVIADELLLLAIDDTTGPHLASGTNLDAAVKDAIAEMTTVIMAVTAGSDGDGGGGS